MTGKPVFVAANKAETATLEADAHEFERWGFDQVFPVSAEHGDGVAEMLDASLEVLPEAVTRESQHRELGIAIVGRPNVGKSSLVNRLVGEQRVIVSPIPGTTRDSVDTELYYEDTHFRLIDTAGIRRKGKTELVAEKISVVMARRNLEQADVAILLVAAIARRPA